MLKLRINPIVVKDLNDRNIVLKQPYMNES